MGLRPGTALPQRSLCVASWEDGQVAGRPRLTGEVDAGWGAGPHMALLWENPEKWELSRQNLNCQRRGGRHGRSFRLGNQRHILKENDSRQVRVPVCLQVIPGLWTLFPGLRGWEGTDSVLISFLSELHLYVV